MKNKFLFVAVIGLLVMACNYLIPTEAPGTEAWWWSS